jgi:hypothetical protein
VEKDAQQYFNDFMDLWPTPGWKQFIEEVESMKVLANSVEATADANDLFFRKGQLQVINSILNLEYIVEAAYKNGKDDAEG